MNEKLTQTWKPLSKHPPTLLQDNHLQLHWAAQIPASIGVSLLPQCPDWSHTSLVWHPDMGLLMSGVANADFPFRVGLHLASATLHLLDQNLDLITHLSLNGLTLAQSMAWLKASMAAANTDFSSVDLSLPDHEMPPHDVGAGASFTFAPEATVEIAHWYANAYAVLSVMASSYPVASPIRCWPHHFDMALLLPLDPSDETEDAKQIGVGLAPSDQYYDTLYFYVTPWPYPKQQDLPPLSSGGTWHTKKWIGAVLRGPEVMKTPTSSQQAETVTAFLRSAIEGSFDLLHTSTL